MDGSRDYPHLVTASFSNSSQLWSDAKVTLWLILMFTTVASLQKKESRSQILSTDLKQFHLASVHLTAELSVPIMVAKQELPVKSL